MIIDNLSVLELISRWLLAILFFFQAYDKVFRIGLNQVVTTFHFQNNPHNAPRWLIALSIYSTAIIEIACSLLLFVGLYRNYALYLLSIDLLIASASFSLTHPMWDMKHVFPRFILIAIQLFIPEAFYTFGIEKFFH